MKTNKKRFAALLALNIVIAGGVGLVADKTPSVAGWVDSWVTANSGGGAFEDQKRGYAVGGSFNARVKTSSDYLFNVQAPSYKVGCGGIDLFAGSLSYLNFDYLVQKMQNVLAAAPAAAFDLALNTLCTPCAQTMKTLSSIADAMNNLQVNDCQAAKAGMAVIMQNTPFIKDVEKTKMQEEKMAAWNSSGMSTWWTGMKETFVGKDGNPSKIDQIWSPRTTAPEQRPENAGCPAEVFNLFPGGSVPNSMIDIIATKAGAVDYADYIRGIVGDVILYGESTNQFQTQYVPPCAENENLNARSFAIGDVYTRSKDQALANATNKPVNLDPSAAGYSWSPNVLTGTGESSVANDCTQGGTITLDGNNYVSLTDYMVKRLDGIITHIKGRQALDEKDQSFLANMSFFPVLQKLKIAIIVNGEEEYKQSLGLFLGETYSYYMMRELSMFTNKLLDKTTRAIDYLHKNPEKECSMRPHLAQLSSNVERLQKNAQGVYTDLYKKYLAASTDYATTEANTRHTNDLLDKLNEKLKNSFGAAVAARLMQR